MQPVIVAVSLKKIKWIKKKNKKKDQQTFTPDKQLSWGRAHPELKQSRAPSARRLAVKAPSTDNAAPRAISVTAPSIWSVNGWDGSVMARASCSRASSCNLWSTGDAAFFQVRPNLAQRVNEMGGVYVGGRLFSPKGFLTNRSRRSMSQLLKGNRSVLSNRHCGVEAFGTDSIPTCRFLLNSAQSLVKKNQTNKNQRTLWGRRDSKPEISPMLKCSYLKLYWSSAIFNMLHSTTVLKQERFELPLKTTVDDQEGEVTEIDERAIFCDCSILLMTIDAEQDSSFYYCESNANRQPSERLYWLTRCFVLFIYLFI